MLLFTDYMLGTGRRDRDGKWLHAFITPSGQPDSMFAKALVDGMGPTGLRGTELGGSFGVE